MRTKFCSFWWAVGAGLLFGACSAQSESGMAKPDAGSGADVAGSGSGGAFGSGGAGMGTGGAPASGGTSGGGDAAINQASGSGGTPADAAGGDGGPVATGGCADNNYAVCMDFEKLPDAKWTGFSTTDVQMGKAAHGLAAFHGPPTNKITTTQLGTITNVMWGRFYLHMTPKAPVGHGELIGVFDQAGNWYEVGFEYNALQGNWHGNGGEKYMRTKMVLPDKYVCVEFLMDGAMGAAVQLWMDGVQIQYYDIGPTKGPNVATKFTKFEIGFNPYHGLSTVSYEGNTMPMTDAWIDDIALDTKRIGCLAN